jgi:hypothetical protein
MLSKSKLGVISIIAILMLSMSASLAAAQYTTQKTSNIVLSSDGTCTIDEADLGITYVIHGTAAATGTVSTALYNGNPQPTAEVPSGITLNHFVVVTFDMASNDFSQATITLSYTDSDVANLNEPYSVFKYVPETQSYVELPSTVDTAAKTITVTLTSVNDPLLAIGGTSIESTSEPLPLWTWIAVTVSVIVVIVIVAFGIMKYRRQ